MDALFIQLRAVLREALNGPQGWIFVLVVVLTLLVTLGILVAWVSRGDAVASAALKQRALAQREPAAGQAATQPR